MIASGDSTHEPPVPSSTRRWLAWGASIIGGALFLWLASNYLEVWPSQLVLASPLALGAAVALQIPYALVRSMRLQFIFDPLVVAASKGRRTEIDRSVLHGTGWVSFWVLLALPFKLGEFSRPLLLAREAQPGVGFSEALGAVAAERLIDGIIICGMLFLGLALADVRSPAQIVDVRSIGLGLLAVLAVSVGILVVAARNAERAGRVAGTIASVFGEAVGGFAERIVQRSSATMHEVLVPRQGSRLALWSVVYWAITTLQMWLMMIGTGLELGLASAAAVVAIVGLSIQLPGGPAQAGTFHVGMTVALSLFLPGGVIGDSGSTFVAFMYLLQFFGAAAMAVVGLGLLARRRRKTGPSVGLARGDEGRAREANGPGPGAMR